MTQRRDSPKGQVLLGCACVAHRLSSTVTTQASSFLVSLQNHFWQIGNFILLQPLILYSQIEPGASGSQFSDPADEALSLTQTDRSPAVQNVEGVGTFQDVIIGRPDQIQPDEVLRFFFVFREKIKVSVNVCRLKTVR